MKKIRQLSNVKIIALGFLVIIICGTLLLMLPISSKNHEITSFLDCLFTATSASCVTGLIVKYTYTHWSIIGQCIILLLIQIGGLGFITIGVFFSSFLRKKISLKQRVLIEDSMNTLKLSGGVRLVKRIIKITLFFESLGAIVLSSVFIKDFGIIRGIYYGIFHSVSAFCNAGFDLLGVIEPYCSLTSYCNNYIVNITIMILIVVGGLGFIVWDDLIEHHFQYRKYLLQTKIVLTMTFSLIVGGSILFYCIEKNGILLNNTHPILASFFQSITARTAGFNSVDIDKLSLASKFLLIILMFIGGSPGSCAGGLKTTTMFIVIMIVKNMSFEHECNVFNRRLEDSVIKKACIILILHFFLIISGVFILCILQPNIPFIDLLFEAVSALGTVGITTGITRSLSMLSKIVIILLMYSGRLGSLTFALSLTRSKKTNKCINPTEKVAVG
jgi:trk system potassium uptake protein TrkH